MDILSAYKIPYNRGLALFYNPSSHTLEERIKIPLYYTGLSENVYVSEKERTYEKYILDRNYCIDIPVSIAARGFTWYVFVETV